MSYSVYDFVGNLGVLFILGSYFFLIKGKWHSSTVSYTLFNALGAGLILVSLWVDFNLSAAIVEGAWLIISLYGMAKNLKEKGR